MTKFNFDGDDTTATLKTDRMAQWISTNWIPQAPDTDWVMVGVRDVVLEQQALKHFADNNELEEGILFLGRESLDEGIVPFVMQHTRKGDLDESTGTYVYHFEMPDGEAVDVLVVSAYYSDSWYQVSMACVPQGFLAHWAEFVSVCSRFAYPEAKVMVIGGNTHSYEATVDWESIILPDDLKETLLNDVKSFFKRGVDVYKNLNLNPFRKILLAGVPGTGKTMLCNALAKWALDNKYQAIYVSSADQEGSKFWKIQHALFSASNSKKPSLIILEEIDAYLHDEEKALILNVLDGSEAFENEFGTLLVATTNYPEAIDKRVLKRPGRLDRIYVVPPVKNDDQAAAMLKLYLRHMWREEHAELAQELVGYPGSFVREVVIYALTQLVEDETYHLTVDRLRDSFVALRDQINARDNLILQNAAPNGQPKTGFVK